MSFSLQKNRSGFLLRLVGFALLALTESKADAADGSPALAINLTGFSYWSHEWMFVDLLKRCKDWGGNPGTDYTTDKAGWINWVAPGKKGNAMVGDPQETFQRNFPLGRYVALYEGEGKMSVQCTRCREVSRSRGRLVVDILESNYVWIAIESVKPDNYIRNLRVVPIEYESTHLAQPFHPLFLERLRPFAAVRYNGPQNTNGNLIGHWSERTKPANIFQDAPGGVAIEYLIQLSNATATDPWLNVPPRVDDDYVRNFARTIFSGLAADRKVYLEYGNEIWNEAHPFSVDAGWMIQQARRQNIPLSPGDDSSDMTYRLRYQVYRSRKIFEIFRQEMDALKIDRRRLVRIIASHSAFKDRIRFTLDYKFPDGSLGYQHADALAVGPYFGGFWTPEQSIPAESKWSVNEILNFEECTVSDPASPPAFCAGLPFQSIVKDIQMNRELARDRGLRLLGYEGGQHMLAWNHHAPFVEKLKTVNRSPRMKDIYLKYLDQWRRAGGELMFLTSFVRPYADDGYFGMLESQDQPIKDAPKFDASMQFLAKQPRWWGDAWPAKSGPPNRASGGNTGLTPPSDQPAAPGTAKTPKTTGTSGTGCAGR